MKKIYVIETTFTSIGSDKIYTIVELSADYEMTCEADADRCFSDSFETKEEALQMLGACQRKTSDMDRLYRDERGYIFVSSELEKSYQELKATGETEEETFADYLANCTSKNGTLTEIK